MADLSNACYTRWMAKSPPHLAPITETDIAEYLLNSDDFQFEIDIFRLCRDHGFTAAHGGIYQDPTQKKDRQFDVRAEMVKGACLLKLAVECKNLRPHRPLLVSRVPRLEQESFHEIITVQAPGAGAITGASLPLRSSQTMKLTRFKKDDSVFPSSALVGKSTAQISRESNGKLSAADSEAHDKWSQAIASCYDLVTAAKNDYAKTGRSYASVFVQPVLVVATEALWVADYTTDGKLDCKAKQTDGCTLYLDKTIRNDDPRGTECTISHLLILTRRVFGISYESEGSES